MKITKTASGKTEIRITKKEWELIGKKAQWDQMGDPSHDDSYLDHGPTSPHGSSIKLFDSATGETKEIDVVIRFDVEPKELEGPNTFYPGGVKIKDVKTTEDVTINGQLYPHGTDASTLISFFADETTWEDYLQYVEEFVLGDVDVPENNYPRTR